VDYTRKMKYVLWKIVEDGFIRHSKSRARYVIPSESFKNSLENYIKYTFDTELQDVKVLEVLDEYSHNSVVIKTRSGITLKRVYDENRLPEILQFGKHKEQFDKCYLGNNNCVEIQADLIVSYGSVW
jgi:hypothetical protein